MFKKWMVIPFLMIYVQSVNGAKRSCEYLAVDVERTLQEGDSKRVRTENVIEEKIIRLGAILKRQLNKT